MYDGIFFINSALNVNSLSVYSNEERFEHTLKTIESIDKYCPNNLKFMFDGSPQMPDQSYLQELSDRKVSIVYTGDHPDVNRISAMGSMTGRSVAECISFILFLNWFRNEQNVESKRIYKISGRYQLNDNFVIDSPDYKDAFVFTASADSHMPIERQNAIGVHRAYGLRLWHMDYSLLETFHKELSNILSDCAKFGIDVEHSYYKNLHRYKKIELPKIGVEGWVAPLGIFEDE